MILDVAREQVLERGVGLDEAQTLEVLSLPDASVDDALELAHEVRMRWCGPEVEVEGIVSIKTGGCPEDCHFCSQSGRFETPVRAVRLDIPSLVEAARETAATGATEFCIVAAVRGPDERLMEQVRDGVAAITAAVEINVACSLGILTREQGVELAELGVHRYNHNLETARSHFGNVVTTHSWEERWETLQLVRELGMEVCCGGIIGMGESLEQRAELAAQFAALDPDEVPLNFLDPRPGTPFASLEPVPALDALRTIAAFRLASAAHDPALRRRARADAGRPGRAPGHGRRDQRGDRRQLPDDAGARSAGGSRPAGVAVDAGQGAREDAVSYCAGCGKQEGDHSSCLKPLDPPRFCTQCGRKLKVQVLPTGYSGVVRPLPVIEPSLHRSLRTIESAIGPKVMLDGREVLLLCSNDYLGLAGDPRVREAAASFASRWGAGAGASPLVSGNMAPHRELCARLAELKGTEACVLFGSGFLANTGVIAALCTRRRGRLGRPESRVDRRRLPARARADARI